LNCIARQIARVAKDTCSRKINASGSNGRGYQSILDHTGNGVQFQIFRILSFSGRYGRTDLLQPDRILIGGDAYPKVKKATDVWFKLHAE
jgi:hypothetical protein